MPRPRPWPRGPAHPQVAASRAARSTPFTSPPHCVPPAPGQLQGSCAHGGCSEGRPWHQLFQAGKAVSQTAGVSRAAGLRLGGWAPAYSQGGWTGKRPRGLAQCVQAARMIVCPQWHKGEKLLLSQGCPRMSEITCPEGSRVQSHPSPPQRSGVGTAEAWPLTPDSSLRASFWPLNPCPHTWPLAAIPALCSEAGPLHLRGLCALLGAAGPSLPASLP